VHYPRAPKRFPETIGNRNQPLLHARKHIVSRRRSLLAIETTTADGASVLTVSGVLDGTTYVSLRDAIKKAALDRPRAVIVDIAGLIVIGGSAWAVFPPAGWYISDEQNVPMGLICNTIDGRRALCRNAVDRYVPAYRTLDAAIAELTGNNRDRLKKVGQFRAASSPAVLASRTTG
jgi:hypothetical protein